VRLDGNWLDSTELGFADALEEGCKRVLEGAVAGFGSEDGTKLGLELLDHCEDSMQGKVRKPTLDLYNSKIQGHFQEDGENIPKQALVQSRYRWLEVLLRWKYDWQDL